MSHLCLSSNYLLKHQVKSLKSVRVCVCETLLEEANFKLDSVQYLP